MFGAGDAPKAPDAPHIPLQQSGQNLYQIAEQLYKSDYGDKSIFPNGFPSYEECTAEYGGDDIRNDVEKYLGDRVTGDLTKSEVAYQGPFRMILPRLVSS